MRRIRSSTVGAALLLWMASHAFAAELAFLRNGFTIRHDHRLALGDSTRLFLEKGESSYVDVPTAEIQRYEIDLSLPAPLQAEPAAGADLERIVNSTSARYRLDPDLVNSVIHAESGFNTRAVSKKGARGLMQLMPGTAAHLGVDNPFDPEANVAGGTRYLRELLERYNFDLVKALAAYNAGPLRVAQYRGVPPYRETRAYVAKIVHDYNRKKIAQQKQAAAARPASPRKTAAPQPESSRPSSPTAVSQH